MRQRLAWFVLGASAVVGILALWFSIQHSSCVYRESDPSYSADGKFYSQMQFSICRDHAKSYARLVMGEAGKKEKNVLLDMAPDIGVVDVSWRPGPELQVRVAESVITKHYGPYERLPRVSVINP